MNPSDPDPQHWLEPSSLDPHPHIFSRCSTHLVPRVQGVRGQLTAAETPGVDIQVADLFPLRGVHCRGDGDSRLRLGPALHRRVRTPRRRESEGRLRGGELLLASDNKK